MHGESKAPHGHESNHAEFVTPPRCRQPPLGHSLARPVWGAGEGGGGARSELPAPPEIPADRRGDALCPPRPCVTAPPAATACSLLKLSKVQTAPGPLECFRRVKTGGEGRARGQRSGETPGPRAGTPPEAALTPCICPPSPEARCPRCRPPPAHFFIFLVPRWAATMGEPAGGLRGWRAGALGLALLALAGGAGTRAQTGAPPSPRGGPRASPPGAAQRRVTSPPTTTRWWWGSCSPLLRPAEAPAPARGPPTSPPRSPEPLLPRPPPPTPRPLAVPLQGASSGEPPPATRHRPRRLRPARGGPEPRAAAGTPTD